jgi:hypothetical protein
MSNTLDASLPGGRLWRHGSARLTDALPLAEGGITAEELDEVHALLADRSFVDCPFLVVVAWGRRPQIT